jgi:hypothetical protein
MDDTNKSAALDQAARDALDEEDRAFDDHSDGIDWDEITATTQPDWEAGRFSFDSADYPHSRGRRGGDVGNPLLDRKGLA